MKTKTWILAVLLAISTLARGATNDLTGLLQKGLFEEEANRNLDAAIANYQSLAAAFDKDRQLAATAIFRLGECYRKLGKTDEAVLQYQRIIKEFSDQQTLATLSRQNLAGLNREPKPSSNGGYDSALLDAEVNAASLQAQIEEIEKMPHDEKRVYVQQNFANPFLTELTQEFNLAQQNLLKTKIDYTSDHPKYKSAQELAEDLSSKLDAQVDGVVRSLKGKLAVAQTQLRLQQKRQADLHEGSVGQLSSASRQLLTQRIGALNNQLAADQAELQQLLTKFVPSHPLVVAAQRKIDVETADLKALTEQIPNAQTPNVSSEPATTDEEQTQIRIIQAMIQNSPDLINAGSRGPTGDRTPLQLAAENGQLIVAKYLLDHGAEVDARLRAATIVPGRDALGQCSPLYLAANAGQKAMVELLLARGADANGAGLANPLYAAVSHGFTGVAEVLIANKADVNANGDNGKRPLHAAVSNDKTNLIQSLIEHGADVNAKDGFGYTPLRVAAWEGKLDAAKILLAAKADVEASDRGGYTPLLAASSAGQYKIVSLLLDSGASVDATNQNLTTPLEFGINRESTNVVRTLLAHKADPNLNSRPDQNWTIEPPVVLAASRNNPAIVQMLLEAGANPNWGWPIFNTLRDGGAPNLKLLLQHGADPNATNSEGHTPLFLTTNPELVRLLIDYKADLNARDLFGDTPVMRANDDNTATNFVKILADAGAKLDLQDTNGNTALHFAVNRIDPECVRILLEHKANPNIQNNAGYTPLDIAKARSSSRSSMMAANGGFPNRGRRPGSAVPILASSVPISASSTTTVWREVEQKIVDLLVNAGGLQNLPKRDRIEARRGADTVKTFYKDSRNSNRCSLLELIANTYGILSQDREGEWQGQTVPEDYRRNLFGHLPFPDFRNVVIYRRTNASAKQTVIKVDVEEILKTGDCSRDSWLEWGDIVEIPESDHPVDQKWFGLSNQDATSLIKCVSREVTIKIKGENTTVKLSPEIKAVELQGDANTTGGPATKLTSASFMLRSVLDNSKLIRVSSDLSRVKVTRIDPETKKKVEWIVDCTNNQQSNLWLRDGDIIDVPEK